MRILIIDDEPASLSMMSLTLEEEGYEVRTAASAGEALRAAERFIPELVIADFHLKDRHTGAQTCQMIKSRLPAVRFIMISGTPKELLTDEFGALEPLGILEKPCELEELLRLVRGAADSLASRQANA